MKLTSEQLWQRFQTCYREYPSIGLSLDISRMNFSDDYFARMAPAMRDALAAMSELERGAIANPDERRMVGHYWLRAPELAPDATIRTEIEDALASVEAFAEEVHLGRITGVGGLFQNLLVIGIGGSALGPQFVANALSHPRSDKLRSYFFDNTDPDGMDKTLAQIGDGLSRTLCVVISKSGGTKETRNGMLEAKFAYEHAGLSFAQHACAVTGVGSQLEQTAMDEKWIRRFPMWDWVGGRTSVMSAVGLLPAALQGFNIREMLAGAKAADEVSRDNDIVSNPSSLMAFMWNYIGNGKGSKDMVILPYKDRLELLSKYLQQLIMESLGKELDLDGKVVNQGIAVYGNKGSTDQHAYVQQLREGVLNFFVTFVEVLKDRDGASKAVDPGVTSGDYLSGFFLGTREALYEKGRESITITLQAVSPFAVGVLIALYERAVGLYAQLVRINAYHQPGVEAGKKAATAVINLQSKIMSHLGSQKGRSFTVQEIAAGISSENQVEWIFKVCEHLAANPESGVRKVPGSGPFQATYGIL